MIERSTLLKCTTLALAEIEMLFFSGIGFGMNSLFPTLTDLNYFCTSQNNSNPCEDQRKYLGYLLITTIISYSVVAVPIGVFFDYFGNCKTKIVGSVVVFFGCLFYGLSSVSNQYLAFAASIMLGFLAQILLTCNVALSIIYPSFQNKIISIYSGSFDSSNIMMTFITLGYRRGISILTSFLVLAFVGFFLFVSSATLSYIVEKMNIRKADKVIASLMDSTEDVVNIPQKNSYTYLENIINKRYPNLRSAIFNKYYAAQVAYLTILFFRYTFFLAELTLQLAHLFAESQSTVNTLLINGSYVFVCGVLFSPLPGIIIDFVKIKTKKILTRSSEERIYDISLLCLTPSLFFCTTMNIIMSVFVLIPHQASIYLSYIAFMLMRVTLFSTNSSYLLQAFPKKYFGKLFGIGVLVSGTFSFLQYSFLFEDSKKLAVVNYSLIGLVSLTYIHPILLLIRK